MQSSSDDHIGESMAEIHLPWEKQETNVQRACAESSPPMPASRMCSVGLARQADTVHLWAEQNKPVYHQGDSPVCAGHISTAFSDESNRYLLSTLSIVLWFTCHFGHI